MKNPGEQKCSSGFFHAFQVIFFFTAFSSYIFFHRNRILRGGVRGGEAPAGTAACGCFGKPALRPQRKLDEK